MAFQPKLLTYVLDLLKRPQPGPREKSLRYWNAAMAGVWLWQCANLQILILVLLHWITEVVTVFALYAKLGSTWFTLSISIFLTAGVLALFLHQLRLIWNRLAEESPVICTIFTGGRVYALVTGELVTKPHPEDVVMWVYEFLGRKRPLEPPSKRPGPG